MIKLSILVSTLLERSESLTKLLARIEPQLTPEVEILILNDNRMRPTGSKFQSLLDISAGQYVTFIDDDDLVGETYVADVIAATGSMAHVIVYDSQATLNDGEPFLVRPSLTHKENEQVRKIDGKYQDLKRTPWHWCAWRRDIAILGRFSPNYIDPDWYWLQQIIPLSTTEQRIDKTLHFYQYNSSLSKAGKGESTTNGTYEKL